MLPWQRFIFFRLVARETRELIWRSETNLPTKTAMQQCTIILLPCGVAMEIRNLARIMKKQNGWSDVFYRIWVGVLCYQFHLHLPTHTNLKICQKMARLGQHSGMQSISPHWPPHTREKARESEKERGRKRAMILPSGNRGRCTIFVHTLSVYSY